MQIDIFVAADAEILEKEVDARSRYVLPGEIVVAKFLNDAGLKKKNPWISIIKNGRQGDNRYHVKLDNQ